jgi:signal transduction histidine kinase
VFDRFYRGAAARRSNATGSGLGLAIVRWIVQRHTGSIRLEKREGGGTIVTVRIPLLAPSATQPKPAAQVEPAPA